MLPSRRNQMLLLNKVPIAEVQVGCCELSRTSTVGDVWAARQEFPNELERSNVGDG